MKLDNLYSGLGNADIIYDMKKITLYNELYFLITDVQKDIVDAQIEDNMRERDRINDLKNRLVNHMNRTYKSILDQDKRNHNPFG